MTRAETEPPPLSLGDFDGNPPGIGFLALLREDLRVNGGTIVRTRVLGGRRPPVRQLADGRPVQAVPRPP